MIKKIVLCADVVIEILDARDTFGTRNTDLEKMVRKFGRKLLFVINKADLVQRKDIMEFPKSCVISSKDPKDRKKLLEFIKSNLAEKPARVAIVGYPNVGKSTIINLLKGRRSASVAPIPGHTKGVQWIRIDEDILLLDSPGIVPSYERDEVSIALKGAIEADQLKNPEYVAHKILEEILQKDRPTLEKFYDVKFTSGDPQDILIQIAIRRGRLLKGKTADTLYAAKTVIRDRYKGKI